jgi:hypothetical protein
VDGPILISTAVREVSDLPKLRLRAVPISFTSGDQYGRVNAAKLHITALVKAVCLRGLDMSLAIRRKDFGPFSQYGNARIEVSGIEVGYALLDAAMERSETHETRNVFLCLVRTFSKRSDEPGLDVDCLVLKRLRRYQYARLGVSIHVDARLFAPCRAENLTLV